MYKAIIPLFLITVLITINGCDSSASSSRIVLTKLSYPEGFSVDIFADDVPNARAMAWSPEGILYVGSRGAGKVYALIDEDENYTADSTFTIAEGLQQPSGVAYHNGSLYVAAINRILRYDNIDNQLKNPPEPVTITDAYPDDTHHGWKYIGFGPDGMLYVPVGAPCNICNPENETYATITRIHTDGSGREIVAHGVRNSVGFDWHPVTGELWFTDNGRDWLGDNQPPDELNRLSRPGQHFGYPYKHGSEIWDPDFGEEGKLLSLDFEAPAMELAPHAAALGMIFYTGSMFPEAYSEKILIAEHGSWNRTEKIGYRITAVSLKSGKAVSYEPFIEGWLENKEAVWGRPVDLLELPDGSVLISDDSRGIIYRVTYNN